jgi:hypothetical protein
MLTSAEQFLSTPQRQPVRRLSLAGAKAAYSTGWKSFWRWFPHPSDHRRAKSCRRRGRNSSSKKMASSSSPPLHCLVRCAHMVKKADGSWRPCQDFHRLNLVTKLNIYPLSNMLELAAKAARSSPRLTCRRGITRSMSSQSAEPCSACLNARGCLLA